MSSAVIGKLHRGGATIGRIIFNGSRLGRSISVPCYGNRSMSDYRTYEPPSGKATSFGLTAVAVVSGYVFYKLMTDETKSWKNIVLAKEPAASTVADKGPAGATKQSSPREMRFLSFASVEYEGNVYMTPQDFLESVAEESPRPRTSRRHLRQSEVEKFLKGTPFHTKGSGRLFRNQFDKGIISYTEYLFLLCVLTKPKSGFHIAFNMFDTDGDKRVDKKEFLVLQHLLASSAVPGEADELLDQLARSSLNPSDIEKTDAQGQTSIRFNIWKLLEEKKEIEEAATNLLSNTTLTVHFFGYSGKDVLKFEDFHRFMENLQTEMLELEFNEFSHGMPTITEEEFAQVLLRYTVLSKERHDAYLDRLRRRVRDVKGIRFEHFKEFFQFLNNLDDFSVAMRVYTYSDHPISEADFQRAVKACMGKKLNPHVIHVVFQLFDVDGDGRLSHQEFISVMKERVHRGARPLGQTRWDNYRSCVRNEMKSS